MAKKAPVRKAEEKVIDSDKIDKVQTLSRLKKMDKKYGKVATIEIKQRDPYVPRAVEAKIREDVMKMKAITANDLAAKFDIRVSAVKKLLLTMRDEGKLEVIAGSARLKVFNPK